jgi:hypothetical protein
LFAKVLFLCCQVVLLLVRGGDTGSRVAVVVGVAVGVAVVTVRRGLCAGWELGTLTSGGVNNWMHPNA